MRVPAGLGFLDLSASDAFVSYSIHPLAFPLISALFDKDVCFHGVKKDEATDNADFLVSLPCFPFQNRAQYRPAFCDSALLFDNSELIWEDLAVLQRVL